MRIFTLPFDKVVEGFPDEIVTAFCINKKVHQIQTQFFITENKPYWSVSVMYEILSKEEGTTRELDESQNQLFMKLKAWRREKSDKEGMPAYLIATNAHLIQMIRLKCISLESLKALKGFGTAKIQKYGKEINELIKLFYEQ